MMAKCTQIRRRNRKVCIGSMNTLITLQNRDIIEPVFNSVDYDENFSGDKQVLAVVNTVSGQTFFDGVNTDINITHEIYIRYDASVTAETWVLYDGRRLDILGTPEDLDGRHEYMKLTCTDRGSASLNATKA